MSHPPVFLDFATTVVAQGKIQAAIDKGSSIPEGWMLDASGSPTTDPTEQRRGGVMLTFGKHKGYCLSFLVEILSGGLTGASCGPLPAYRPDYATVMMAVNIAAFQPLDEFRQLVDEMIAATKASARAPGVEEILVPGEPEWRRREVRLRLGVDIPEPAWQRIVEAGAKCGVVVTVWRWAKNGPESRENEGGMMSDSLDLGTIKLDLVLDRYGEVDGNQVFCPATQEEWSPGLDLNERGALRVMSNALLINADGQLTLVDTGWGEAIGWGDAQAPQHTHGVLNSLARLGVAAQDIQRVILTHAHGDHVCGNTIQRDGRWSSAFPRAEYVIQLTEAEAARRDEETWRVAFEPLIERGQLRTISGWSEIGPTVACWPTPGHTIGHQSVLIRSPQRQVLFVGDLAVLAKNMERLEWGHSWAWSLDADRISRREVAEWAITNRSVLIIGHDPERPMVSLERAGEGYRAVPLPRQGFTREGQ